MVLIKTPKTAGLIYLFIFFALTHTFSLSHTHTHTESVFYQSSLGGFTASVQNCSDGLELERVPGAPAAAAAAAPSAGPSSRC